MIFLKPQQKVRIHCPSEAKWPSFHRAFHGKVGKVVEVRDLHAKVDISTEKVSVPYINVDKAWLGHAD